MHIFERLFLAIFGIISIGLVVWADMSSNQYSIGNLMVIHSLLPAGAMLLVAASMTEQNRSVVEPLAVSLVGLFLVLLCAGMYTERKESFFLLLALISIGFMATITYMQLIPARRPS